MRLIPVRADARCPYRLAVLIDVRRGASIGVKEKRALVAVPTPKPPAGTAFPPRRLTLRGTPVFDLNLWCGTCPALFTRLNEPDAADLGVTNERLRGGLSAIDDSVLKVYGGVLPRSTYTVLLLEATPQLVEPGDPSDYFSHEQVTTWGIDPALGAPEDPGTPYYRTFETPVDRDSHMYEFIVPMVPPQWNDEARVAEYAADTSAPVTAVAYTLLDVLEPATGEPEDHYQHWTLTHFLLDGHHKVEAAARAQRAIRVLALIDEQASIASLDDVAKAIAARSRGHQPRA